MNTRRGFIGKSIAAIAAMFGVRHVAAAEDSPDLPRGPFGYVIRHRLCPDEPARLRVELLQKAYCTNAIFVKGPDHKLSPDELLFTAGKEIECGVRLLMREGATDIRVQWLNIEDSRDNPNNECGFFYVLGRKTSDGSPVSDHPDSGGLGCYTSVPAEGAEGAEGADAPWS